MNLKLEVKLGQLMKICPQVRAMVEKFLLKMKEDHVVNVCKVVIKVGGWSGNLCHVIRTSMIEIG
jgi:hypothetical protein